MINHAVILSAGFGTRFLPYTKSIPKTMLPINNIPAIEYIIREAIECNIQNITVVLGHNGDIIKNHFTKNAYLDKSKLSDAMLDSLTFYENINLQFATQNIINGTASAILSAKKTLGNNDFLIMNGDELIFKNNKYECNASQQLINYYDSTNCTIVGTQKVSKIDASMLGVIKGKKINNNIIQLQEIVEKPNIVDIKEPIVNLGRYIVKNDIFDYLENVKPNYNNEFALTDALVNYSQYHKVLCCNFEGKRYDIGNQFSYMQAIFDQSMKDKTYGKDFKEYVLKNLNY